MIKDRVWYSCLIDRDREIVDCFFVVDCINAQAISSEHARSHLDRATHFESIRDESGLMLVDGPMESLQTC